MSANFPNLSNFLKNMVYVVPMAALVNLASSSVERRSALLYEEYCKTPLDRIGCASFYANKEINGIARITTERMGPVFLLVLNLMIIKDMSTLMYRKFKKLPQECRT